MTLGIDVGGTNLVVGLVQDGKIVKRESAPWFPHEATLQETIDTLSERIAGIITPDTEKIGIGVPSVVDVKRGIVYDTVNIPSWTEVPLKELLEQRFGLPVAVNNDANCYAMGVYEGYPVDAKPEVLVVITLGTGVGSGIVVNGQLLYGHDGFAGELGHVTMVRGAEGRSCGCGRTGCLEAYCSATGVARTARELLAKTDRPSLLRDMDPEKITSLDVSIAAGKGDELAKEIYEFTGKMLGEACADFAAFSSPEAFIFFGGMVKAGELIMKPIREAYNAHVMNIFKNKAQFLVSGLDGASAAVLGASAIGWEIQ